MTRIALLSHAGACVALVLAASVGGAQQRPAARPLGPAVATSGPLRALSAVRQLPGGRVLVNDPGSLQVLLLDSTLKLIKVVADSTSSTANAYGARPGGLIAYRGDSTLFVDPASMSMLVIDPQGNIARVMAAPSDASFLVGGALGNPGFDAQGRLVYRAFALPFGRAARGAPAAPNAGPPAMPDSAPLLRYDLAARRLDTLTHVRVNPMRMHVVQSERGMSMTSIINPMPVVDDWAVLPDGSVALVRGREYRLDVMAPDGTRTTGEKIAFDWQRLPEEDKARVIDSAQKAMEAARNSNAVVLGGTPAGVVGGGGGTMVTTMRMEGTIGGGPPTVVSGGAPPAGERRPVMTFVQPSELPDYRPAFSAGASRADAEGRVWVRTIPTKPLAGGPEYDVIDRAGRLVERVAIPAGTTIVGFGSGGIVYLGVRDAAGTHLVRARVR